MGGNGGGRRGKNQQQTKKEIQCQPHQEKRRGMEMTGKKVRATKDRNQGHEEGVLEEKGTQHLRTIALLNKTFKNNSPRALY